jgi:hypothetical protein
MSTNRSPFLSRPKDRSVEAYKVWMEEVINYINPDAENNMTDELWAAGHKEFWLKVDEAEAKAAE